MARETIRAIAAGGNPMGIPMLLSRMLSHPNFGGKMFALGGTVGLTTLAAALKGRPQKGDKLILAGGRTGNDGIHGATISSGEMTEKVDTGDIVHVQIGNPFTEQPFMRAIIELFIAGCIRAINDFGAAGIPSAIGEMAELCGMLVNLALVKLKVVGLADWQVLISESQERMAFAIIPEKMDEAMAIFTKYGIEATAIGVATGDHRFKVMYDPKVTELYADMPLSGEVCIDVPYEVFDRCPPSPIEIIEPPKKTNIVTFPEITTHNIEEMGAHVTGYLDVCNQSWETRQYDATVQGIQWSLPLYGRDYNVATHLAAQRPAYVERRKQYGLTYSQSFSPPQFEVDPTVASVNAMLDTIVTQIIGGVKRLNICLADNFYTPNLNPYAWWHLVHQVEGIARLSEILQTPFITGKDSSAGSATIERLNFVIHVLCSVVITAMGKIPDVRELILHQWQSPESLLIAVGPRAKTLSGSLLASSLGIIGNELEGMTVDEGVREYIDRLSSLVKTGSVLSSVPINRGGLFLRLFEGIVASGFGVNCIKDPADLFPESFGAALLEVPRAKVIEIINQYPDLRPTVIGNLTRKQQFIVDDKVLDWSALYEPWNTTFEKEVKSCLAA
jgi:phosphoribosylformylglycinamidine (FGAM) synthase-like enzyme